MQQHSIQVSFDEYVDITTLNEQDAALLLAAREAIDLSYAPYSRFQVGAAARLNNGVILKGSNQENASFPAGICAERVLLSICSSLYPGIPIVDMAISYNNQLGLSNKPISPCGVCRQSLCEYENRVNHSIRLILSGLQGNVFIIGKATDLLPLAFSSTDMK
ncbi:MAG: cytidine deaminase [Bacteroidota bacterium]